MDCNRDDALSAMQFSDRKLRNKDFAGAMKMAQKAQRLFPELENISQLLAVCQVQCSAENKVGSAMDWYGILQLQQDDDEETIKKQYRKLALLLHPDKNKFAGAEAAFKLIGEAKRFLADQETRSKYDKKYSKALRKSGNSYVKSSSNGNATLNVNSKAERENLSSNENLYNDVDFVNPPKIFEHSGLSSTPEKKDSDHGDEGKCVDLSRPDPARSKGPRTSENMNKKRGRSSTFESYNSYKSSKTNSKARANSKLNEGHLLRKSSRDKQNLSSSGNKNSDDDLVIPPKSLELKYTAMDGEVCKNDRPIDSGTKSIVAFAPKVIEVCDAEFNKFEIDGNSLRDTLKTNQAWALFDNVDGMPRVYVIIRKVFARGEFKVRITWLIPDPDEESEIGWVAKGFPVACGKFRLGLTEDTTDHHMFSHEMHCTKGRGRSSYLIYPRKGETWALYKNWDIKWSPNPEKHMPFEFEFVEVISDFSENVGTEVAYLGKVEGFTSLFQRTKQGLVSFVPHNELYRFSHPIPSCKMSGGEKRGVEKGWFELDPASLPAVNSKVAS